MSDLVENPKDRFSHHSLYIIFQEKEESKKKSSKDEDSEDDSDTGRPILAGLKTAIKFRCKKFVQLHEKSCF